MKMKVLLSIAVLTAATFAFTACSDDKDDNKEGNELEAKESFLATTNKDMVNKTILPIYTNLMNANKQLVEAIGKMDTQADVNKACDLWKIARKSRSFMVQQPISESTHILIHGRSIVLHLTIISRAILTLQRMMMLRQSYQKQLQPVRV